MAPPFLKARWLNLCIVSWAMPRKLLAGRVPRGLELDEREGQAFASLVAFQFRRTRVHGVSVPFHRDFDEWNLRFYVREPSTGRRGVMFISELAPRRLVGLVARRLYNEPFEHARVRSKIDLAGGREIAARYTVTRGGRDHAIAMRADRAGSVPDDATWAHWFKELRWGFGVDRDGRPIAYEVNHPRWATHAIREHEIDVDWAALYGKDWAELNDRRPHSLLLARGSEVTIFGKERRAAT